MDPSPRTLRIAALGLILALASATAVALGFYTRAFGNPALVTVDADRTGLIMDPGNKVKARGVEIGRVGSVVHRGNGIRLTLELDRDQLGQIPSNSIPELRASTVFGAKYVELAYPGAPSGQALSDGSVLRAQSVTTEINTIFDQLDSVLSEVDVAAVNTTLTTLSTSLGGRGEQIADLAAKADAYLTVLEPQLPQLRRDLAQVATFSEIAEDVSPDFLKILKNATVTGETIADKQKKLDHLLVGLALLGDRGTDFIDDNGGPLTRLVKNLQTPTATLRKYSPVLPCFIRGAERDRQIMTSVFGAGDAGLRAEVSVRMSSRKYVLPKDRLAPAEPGKPSCTGMPIVARSEMPIPQVGEAR